MAYSHLESYLIEVPTFNKDSFEKDFKWMNLYCSVVTMAILNNLIGLQPIGYLGGQTPTT